MDNELYEQYIQDLEKFIHTPVYDWVKKQFNANILKKLEDLHFSGIKDEEKVVRLKSGEISGFKQGFEFIEKLISDKKKKEGDK